MAAKKLSYYFKKADKALSEYIRAKTPHCVLCGSRENLTAGHLITRNSKSVRYDLRNVETQCSGCNLRHEYRPEIFTAWYIETYGMNQYMELVADSKHIKKYTPDELQMVEAAFKSRLQRLRKK